MIDTVTNWLGFSLDELNAGEGWAVFPQGETQLAASRDILGSEKRRSRLTFLVVCHSPYPNHATWEEFSRRVRETAPVLGENQTVRLEGVHLSAKGKDGPARYEAKLIFEFTE